MLKRLLVGLVKGLLVGGLVGAGFHFGLGWVSATGLLAYLLAMGSGATAGVLAGKPPWKQQAWIESVLKAVAGLGVGALVYWIASTWLAFGLPFDLPSIAAGTPWTETSLGISTAVATVFGALVELDNTDADGGGKAKSKVRVAAGEEEAVVEEVAEAKASKTRSR